MQVFRKAALRNFENEMVAHLADFSPQHCKAIGKARVCQAIQFGIDRASGYGFNLRGAVRLYLELMFWFGSSFDTDPQYPWAAEILTDPDAGPQMQRADLLYERVTDYLREATYPDDADMLRSIKTLLIAIRQPLVISRETFFSDMRLMIACLYPQKAASVAHAELKALIREGVAEARKQRFSTAIDIALMVVLMLAFGHGCCTDLLYPWIVQTLNDPSIADPATRARSLETQALSWLEHELEPYTESAQA